MKTESIDRLKITWAVLSGLLLTAAMPKISAHWLAWFALVPLLIAIRDLSWQDSFRLGLLSGLIHFLSLLYWLVPTMHTYGNLPWYLCIPVLVLMSTVLALYVAAFAFALNRLGQRPLFCLWLVPVLWVALEYVRSFLLSGFPWALIGYSQSGALHLIQISDITGIYGVSFLIAAANGVVLLGVLALTGQKWQGSGVSGRLAAASILGLVLLMGLILCYGRLRMQTVDRLAGAETPVRISVVQGNIDQLVKWDPAFQYTTTEKYIALSVSSKAQKPDLVVWPETAAPFYFTHDARLTEMVAQGVRKTATYFLIGSPSFRRSHETVDYFNSAYLIRPTGTVSAKYDKVHLVPYGEYVPFKKWLPFLGKMVAQVGDFRSGKKGRTLAWKDRRLGVQICYEIIFPELSRAMVKNQADLLVNITNDAWYGRSSGPYQHFSMTIFRAVENRRSLVRAANTGISGFVDPAGRIYEPTSLFEEAVVTHTVPLVGIKTFYTRFGDLFAMACLGGALLMALAHIIKKK